MDILLEVQTSWPLPLGLAFLVAAAVSFHFLTFVMDELALISPSAFPLLGEVLADHNLLVRVRRLASSRCGLLLCCCLLRSRLLDDHGLLRLCGFLSKPSLVAPLYFLTTSARAAL